MTRRTARMVVAVGIAVVLGTVTLPGIVAPAFGQQGDPARLLASGRQAYEAGNYDQARADLWDYLEATASLSGAERLPQAEALFTIARMDPDAGVAAQHYRTIVDEYPASSVADEAVFRLGQYALVTGRPEEARERFLQLRQSYPVSRLQAEIGLWVGRTHLAERRHRAATDALIEGFSRVRSQDLPFALSPAQVDALSVEYVYWLATAFQAEGDQRTALQYWSLLALDYPGSPLADEAREALAAAGRPVARPGEVAQRTEAPARAEPVVVREEPPPAREEPAPALVREEPVATPAREEPPRAPAREEPPVPREEPPVPREEPAVAREEPPKFPAPTPEAGTLYLQVGAFTSAARAADLSKRLREAGFPSSVEIGIVDGQGYYRVRVGPYRLPAQSAALRDAEARLQRQGFPARAVSADSS